MKKSSIMMLVASAILIAGILITGCTQDSGSTAAQSGSSSASTQAQITKTAEANQPAAGSVSGTSDAAKSGDKPKFNESGVAPSGTPPEGMQMNGTRPSGTPPSGDGTGPSGTPPSGTPPSGTPPASS